MTTNYTAEETVFGIPELRRYILSFYIEKKHVQRKTPKKCKEKLKETAIDVALMPVQCCCMGYCVLWILYKTRCLRDIYGPRIPRQ